MSTLLFTVRKVLRKSETARIDSWGDSLWGFYALLLLESHDGVASHALKANRSIHKARK